MDVKRTYEQEKAVTYIGEIGDLDDTFKELFLSGSVEELCEAGGGGDHSLITYFPFTNQYK